MFTPLFSLFPHVERMVKDAFPKNKSAFFVPGVPGVPGVRDKPSPPRHNRVMYINQIRPLCSLWLKKKTHHPAKTDRKLPENCRNCRVSAGFLAFFHLPHRKPLFCKTNPLSTFKRCPSDWRASV